MTLTTEKFTKLIWSTIQRELDPEKRTILKSMSYNSSEFEQGFIQGLAWASILSMACTEFNTEGYLSEEDEKRYNEAVDKLYKPLGINILEGV